MLNSEELRINWRMFLFVSFFLFNDIEKTKYNFILKSDFYYYLNVMDYAQEAINQHKKYR